MRREGIWDNHVIHIFEEMLHVLQILNLRQMLLHATLVGVIVVLDLTDR